MQDEQNSLEYGLIQVQNQIKKLGHQVAELELRQNLVAKLLSANNKHQSVSDYFHLLNNDFLAFANEENSLQDEAAAFLELQSIGEELKVIGSYPDFYKKRSIAIAGGFSAGKSEFISSLFEDNTVRLPIGIEPTTAIPTYALNNPQKGLIGCNQNGGSIDLLQIDPDFQHKLSHNFIRGFGFNLKNIMPFVFLTTPMPYQNLCFIDTPGYNPSDVADGYTSEDIKTAEEFVHNSESLLWIIGLDANGTIPKSDLDFLEDISQTVETPLYVVLNKADLRPYDQLEDVMNEVVDTLDDYDIKIEGICAYSSITKTEYLYQGQSLFDFLTSLDKPSNKRELILQRLHTVDEKYQIAILKDIKEKKKIHSTLNSLELDLLQNVFDDLDEDVYNKISNIQALYNIKHKEEQLHKLSQTINKMEAAIKNLFGDLSHVERKKWTLDDIELDDKFTSLSKKNDLSEISFDDDDYDDDETTE